MSWSSGVQSAAVNVICELARRNPKNYLSLAPLFFKLMTSSTNNWVLIKIIKLVSSEGGVYAGPGPIVCGDPGDHSTPIPVVRRSDSPGAQAGQEIDRTSHQPHS